MVVNPKEIESVTSLVPIERYRYFLKKVADSEELYLLEYENGEYATSELDGNILIPLWSAKEFAELCRINGWGKCNIKEISLENFEDELIDIITESSYLINVFPVFEKTGFIVDVDEFALDLSDELKNYC
ncbi:MAG: DUF2750 domain-containing protein [Paludibacter sp.]|nr:DUF2750 domain-containing protein [Paludibacter sp.]